MFIGLLLELGFGKLPLLVVEVGTTLGIDSGVVVADHDVLLCCLGGQSGLRSVKVVDAVASTRQVALA